MNWALWKYFDRLASDVVLTLVFFQHNTEFYATVVPLWGETKRDYRYYDMKFQVSVISCVPGINSNNHKQVEAAKEYSKGDVQQAIRDHTR